MGLLSWVEGPIKSIISTLTTPIHEVERIFGTVISDVRAIIEDLIGLLKEIDNLFNMQQFEGIFIKPFESATMDALSGLDKIASLVTGFATEQFEDFGTILEQPIKDAYALIKRGIKGLQTEYAELTNKMHVGATRIVDDSAREIYALIGGIENEVDLIKADIKRFLRVTKADGTQVKQQFVSFFNRERTRFSADINKTGAIAVDSLRDVENSMHNMVQNHSNTFDAIELLIGFALLGIVFGVVFTTGSLALPIGLFLVVGLVLLSYLFV